MVTSNIEAVLYAILQIKGRSGWLAVNHCAAEYARDPGTGKSDRDRKDKFYRWLRRVEEDRVKGFQVLRFSGNVSFLGLAGAESNILESLISEKEKEQTRFSVSDFDFEFLKFCIERGLVTLDDLESCRSPRTLYFEVLQRISEILRPRECAH